MITYLIEHNRYLNIVGIGVILGIAWLFSRNRAAVNWRLVINALVLQVILAYTVLKTSWGRIGVGYVACGIEKLYGFAEQGTGFLFGNLSNPGGTWGFIFAVKVLPIIIFFGALMSLLFYLGIVQRAVAGLSYIVRPLLGTSGAETLCAIANSFLGQTEAPLLISNYMPGMTKSELLVVMVSGMGTISGAILAVFAAMGVPAVHLLTASVMAIPGTILIAKILYPETEYPQTAAGQCISSTSNADNALEAIAKGTSDGLGLALNVGAMLIAFISLIALCNSLLEGSSGIINNVLTTVGLNFQIPSLSLNAIFSWIFAPFGYLLGFTGQEALNVGQLLGTKVTINELIAYGQMLGMHLSERTIAIVTYALCGFSNFSCIGIQIGGIGVLMPEKRQWLAQLGLMAVLGGSLANLLSAMIAGILL